MREQMRSNDRALSNIESHPEGYNHLRRMYENVQVPTRCSLSEHLETKYFDTPQQFVGCCLRSTILRHDIHQNLLRHP